MTEHSLGNRTYQTWRHWGLPRAWRRSLWPACLWTEPSSPKPSVHQTDHRSISWTSSKIRAPRSKQVTDPRRVKTVIKIYSPIAIRPRKLSFWAKQREGAERERESRKEACFGEETEPAKPTRLRWWLIGFWMEGRFCLTAIYLTLTAVNNRKE